MDPRITEVLFPDTNMADDNKVSSNVAEVSIRFLLFINHVLDTVEASTEFYLAIGAIDCIVTFEKKNAGLMLRTGSMLFSLQKRILRHYSLYLNIINFRRRFTVKFCFKLNFL